MAERDRSDSGYGALEYLGLAVLVAGIIVALSVAGIGDELARQIRCAVTAVAGGQGSCGADEGSVADGGSSDTNGEGNETSTRPSGGPSEGPVLVNGDIPILPFPGSVSVSSSVGGYATPDDLPAESGIVGSVTTVVNRSQPKLVRQQVTEPWTQRQLIRRGYDVDRTTRTELRDMVTLEVSTELVGSSQVEWDGGVISGTAGRGEGVARIYKVTVPQQHVQEIEKGRRAAPNPRDPRSIPTGSSVLMSQKYFERRHSEVDVNVLRSWAFGAESTTDNGTEVSSMVQRVDEDEVRIVVGEDDYVQNMFAAGVSYGDPKSDLSLSATASSTDKISSGQARQVVLDISTEEGWNKYQKFVETGKLPDGSADGADHITSSSRVETVKSSSKSELEAEIETEFEHEITEDFNLQFSGGASYSFPLGPSTETKKTVQRNSDGTVEITTQRRNGKVTWTAKQTTDSSGEVTDTSYRMLLDDVNGQWASQYRTANSGTAKNYENDQDIALRFDEEELDSVQQNVYERIAERCRNDRCYEMSDPPTTASEVRDRVRGQDSADPDNNGLYGGMDSTLLSDIARADSDQEMVQALSGHRGMSNNRTLKLTTLAQRLCQSDSEGNEPCSPEEVADYVPGEVATIRSER